MATQSDSLFPTLPTELVHQILAYVEPIDIVRSFRCVCKRFHQIVKNYGRFRLNFKSIDKNPFHFLCNFIRADQIETLVLSDDDETPGQIEYFLSHFRFDRFTRLHSLTLIDVDDCQLNKILKDLEKLRIENLIVQGRNDSMNVFNINNEHLVPIFAQPSLQKVHLRIPGFNLQTIEWPKMCAIQQLTIQCSTIDEYISLLLFLPKLRILTVENFNFDEDIQMTKEKLQDLVVACELSLLTFQRGQLTMPILGLLLSLTPTIEQLQLLHALPLSSFVEQIAAWENFVEIELPLLTKFDFFLVHSNSFDNFGNLISFDPATIIDRFRTPFWLETKQWFVTCDHISFSNTIFLYSNSMIDREHVYYYQSNDIRRYVSIPDGKPNNRVIMEGVRQLSIDLRAVMESATASHSGFPSQQVFPNVETLILRLSYGWPMMSIRFLHGLINLSRVKKLRLAWIDSDDLEYLKILVKDMTDLHSIQIDADGLYYAGNVDALLSFCFLLDNRIKHLTLPIISSNDMFTLQPSIQNRSSVKFQFAGRDFNASQAHLSWLSHEKDYYLCRLSQSSLSLWLDKISKH